MLSLLLEIDLHMSNSKEIKIEIFSIFFKGETKWEETYSTDIRTPP